MSSYQNISVVEPLTPAIERIKTILFRPFDLGKWFVIGFTAWLAYLGKGGGGGGGGGHPGGNVKNTGFKEGIIDAKQYVILNLSWLIPVMISIFLVVLIIWLLIVWLNSRGKFMFLHCVVTNRAEVKVPWYKYVHLARSLFVFQVVLGLISFFALIGPVIVVVILIVGMYTAGALALGGILGGCLLLLAIAIMAITIGLIKMFTLDFVVPIMFIRQTTCKIAWREFMELLGNNTGKFLLYALFKIVLSMAIGVIVMIAFCGTCGCACCISIIPYVGTVLLLPILVFKRSYSLYYIQQYGAQYDVFAAVERV